MIVHFSEIVFFKIASISKIYKIVSKSLSLRHAENITCSAYFISLWVYILYDYTIDMKILTFCLDFLNSLDILRHIAVYTLYYRIVLQLISI